MTTAEQADGMVSYDHFKRHSTDQQKKRLVKRLSDLGFAVELKPLAA